MINLAISRHHNFFFVNFGCIYKNNYSSFYFVLKLVDFTQGQRYFYEMISILANYEAM